MLSYKQSRRREDDLAIVNAGLRVVLEDLNGTNDQYKIGDLSLVYGGMNKTTVMATNTQKQLIGRYSPNMCTVFKEMNQCYVSVCPIFHAI